MLPIVACTCMMMRWSLLILTTIALAQAGESTWPQFRGPGGLGLGTGKRAVAFSADNQLLWKVADAARHCSPCVWRKLLFLTGYENDPLLPSCVDGTDGRQLWRAVRPTDKIEPTHRVGSPA